MVCFRDWSFLEAVGKKALAAVGDWKILQSVEDKNVFVTVDVERVRSSVNSETVEQFWVTRLLVGTSKASLLEDDTATSWDKK